MKVQVSRMIRAPRDAVFAAYIDVQSMPKWSESAREVRVVAREGSRIRFVVQAQTKGGPKTFNGELVLSPPDRVTIENESRGSVTRGAVTFEEAPGGTLVTSTVEVEIRGLKRYLVRPALGDESKAVAERNLSAFAVYVEGAEGRKSAG